jgi:hypothetical protein
MTGKCVACGFDRKRYVTLNRNVFLCDVCCAQAAAFWNRVRPAAPVSEEEGSEGRAAVSDCAARMPGLPVAWCRRPEGHMGDHEYVTSTTVSPYRAPAPPPSTGDDLLSFIRREREKWRSGPKAAFGLLSAPEMVELFDHMEHLASAPPSTGDAPGPSEECHVEGCGWRWPRGSGLGCPQHPSPRAQTGTDEGRGVTDADLRALAAEGRRAGRAEAAAILMEQEADSILDDLTSSTPIGDTGDYSAGWEREKVLHLFDATGSAALSLIDRLDGAYWEATARAEDAARSAALRREERP